MKSPSDLKPYTRSGNYYEKVIKKSKQLAVDFDKKEWNDQIDSQNVWLLGNISKIQNGDYRTTITKSGQAVSDHKLKSLRKESIHREHLWIKDENTKFSNRLGFVNSTIEAKGLLKSSSQTLSHMDHLSKYTISKREMKKLPSLLENTSKSNLSVCGNLKINALKELKLINNKSQFRIQKNQSQINKTSDQSKNQDHYIEKQESVINPDISENFYPKGSLLIEAEYLEGDIKGKSFQIIVKKDNVDEIQKFEYLFDNRSHITNQIPPECLNELEEVSVHVYLKNNLEEEPNLLACHDIE